MVSGINLANSFSTPKGRILLFSYAFPPMQVQMSPTVFKPMAAIAGLGYEVDVLCADSFCKELPLDNSLLPFVDNAFSKDSIYVTIGTLIILHLGSDCAA